MEIEQVILHSEENSEVSSTMLLTEWLALGHTGALVFGATKTVAQVLAIAASAGFDIRTGKARASMEFGGAIPAVVDGKEIMLSWEGVMILNLTQHSATAEQLAVGVVDLPASHRGLLAQSLTVDTLPTRVEIADRCANIAALAVHNGLGSDEGDDPHPTAAMIGGAPWMMAELERALLGMGVPAVYAFSVRESVEQPQPNGSVRKVNVFRHAGFVDAA